MWKLLLMVGVVLGVIVLLCRDATQAREAREAAATWTTKAGGTGYQIMRVETPDGAIYLLVDHSGRACAMTR